MERSAKRKAVSLSADADRPSKKQKTPDSRALKAAETVETTTEAGLQFVDALRRAQDKNGRLIATAFLSLPDPNSFPDYYKHIELPISIETIKAKLENRGYPTMSSLEGDVKRMVNNAKQYNESKSEIYQDAERVRKMTFNHMSKANPAYQKGGYQAAPTPLPSENPSTQPDFQKGGTQVTATPMPSENPKTKIRLTAQPANETPSTNKKPTRASDPQGQSRSASAAAVDEEVEKEAGVVNDLPSFEGKTFQKAQEQLISESMKYKDEPSGLGVFTPFVSLPPRSLTDYYAFIKHPTSLRSVMNKVRGRQGKGEATGFTLLKSWDAFESEVAKIWTNAREYNEDGSDMFLLAGEFEEYFKGRLAEAKKHVHEPPQPKLKLNMAPQPSANAGLKLTLGSQKSSPAPPAQSFANAHRTNGNSAAADQKLTNGQPNGVNLAGTGAGQAPSRVSMAPPAYPVNGVTGPTQGTSVGVKSASPLPALQPNGVPGTSRLSGLVNGASAAALSAGNTSRLSSGSPLPGQAPPALQPYIAYPQYAISGFDSKWRQEGRDPLFSNLHVTTLPDISLPKPLNLTLPSHPTLCQQHLTLHLPPRTPSLRIQPELAPALKGPAAKPHKLFVTANNVRVPTRDASTLPNGPALVEVGPVYDVRLMQGMNRVEVECASIASAKANGLRPGMGELEMEKVCLYVNLMKS